MLHGKDEEPLRDTVSHDAYRSAPAAVARIVATRVGFAVYVQALQRRAHAPRIKDGKRLDLVIRRMKRHKCGFKSIKFQHQFKLVGFIDAAFKAQPGEATWLALRGLAAALREDGGGKAQPMSTSGEANYIDFTVRRQRRVVRSTFSADLNGLVDGIDQVLLLQVTLHQKYIYIYIWRSPTIPGGHD